MVNFPKEMLVDLAWSFTGEQFSSLAEFNDAVHQYQMDILGKDDWDSEAVVINSPQVEVSHDCWETEDEEAKAKVMLTADNGKAFTSGELLFKTHNAFVDQLTDLDHSFFEGFNLAESGEETLLPSYEVYLGS